VVVTHDAFPDARDRWMTRASRRRRVASLARASAGASSVETSVASTVDASRVERRASTVERRASVLSRARVFVVES